MTTADTTVLRARSRPSPFLPDFLKNSPGVTAEARHRYARWLVVVRHTRKDGIHGMVLEHGNGKR